MIIYLLGNSELQKALYVKSFVSSTKCEYRKMFSDEENKLTELRNASQSLGLFSLKKVYDLVNFDEWPKKEREDFFSLDFDMDGLIVFVRTEKMSKEVKKLLSDVQIVELEKPKDWEEEKWIEFIVVTGEKLGIPCPKEIAEEIFKLTGPDEYALISELQKLYTYSDGQFNKITPSELEGLIYKRSVSRVDELGFSITEKLYETAYELVDELLREYDPVLVVSSLGKHFIDLLQIIAIAEKKPKFTWPEIAEISKKTSIQLPKVARYLGFKFKGQTHEPQNHVLIYTLKVLNNAIKSIFYIDRAIKSGGDAKILICKFIDDFSSQFGSSPENTSLKQTFPRGG
ncbi:MAG TPA: DNA polymerase III subunit delta [Fervidobacterium sp.]|nr:DNA polymerase III subunit delta [Fervidobacterium sp.]HOK87261.1 DNA polymerase III subunit delta [Fervidobacterium sp.]HOM73467.1 DNA polymerase III subunit delta [Fervidobacterium sp.]HPP17384.1 DNA polymerase III subunit delta [Fervidobacterium sp.]HRD20196.1 DNA polymerase III subunit delta [Fervidobacterium sp.]